MLHKKHIVLIFFTAMALSCKSSKAILASGVADKKASAKQVIEAHQNNKADFNTLKTNVKIELRRGDDTKALTFGFRMEKDKAIWLNAPLGLARMYITPDRVQFYNKTDNTYFDGNYELLSDFVGIDLNFEKVQAILLGETLNALEATDFKVDINENSYWLQLKNKNALIELFYLINPSHFKMDSLQLQQQAQQRFLQIDYSSYQKVENQTLPKGVHIIAVEGKKEVAVTMDFRAFKFNESLRFPFKMPEGYKEIVIK